MADGKKRVGRWIALGTLIGVTAAWGGFGIIGAAPAKISTCTTLKSGKTKVVTSTSQCKAGKAVGQTWDDHATVTAQVTAFQSQILALQHDAAVSTTQIAKLQKSVDKLNAIADATQARIDAACADVSGDATIQAAIAGNPQADTDFGTLCPG